MVVLAASVVTKSGKGETNAEHQFAGEDMLARS